MPRLLTIPQPHNSTLSPAQRKFNQLQKQIEVTRQRLDAWQAALPPFARAYASQVLPLRTQARELRRELATRLDEWLAEKGWAAGERAVMQDIVCNLAREALDDHELPAEQRAHWRALHDRHAELDLASSEAQRLALLRRMVEEQFDLDLGDASLESEEAFRQHVQAKLRERAAQADASAQDELAKPAPKRKPTAAQQRRQAEREAVAAQAQQGLRDVFRKLASALHPDRASDPADATRRTALMQRVNAAYAKEDLLALLGLQLEIEQIDADHLQRATEAQIRHFNAVLQEQLEELRAELLAQARRFCAEFELQPDREPDPKHLLFHLTEARNAWQRELFDVERDLQALVARDSTKRWVKRLKAAARMA
ncbi:MAG: J domain-containing protein [Inhella sp.]